MARSNGFKSSLTHEYKFSVFDVDLRIPTKTFKLKVNDNSYFLLLPSWETFIFRFDVVVVVVFLFLLLLLLLLLK